MVAVYASKTAMWLVVADVLQKTFTSSMPLHGDGHVDVEKLVEEIDAVYVTGGDESVLHELIRESLDQLIESKMIPDRGDRWTVKA